ncbi:hypothetical protein FRC06_004566, partial [Ceratobasidium sp. 370]
NIRNEMRQIFDAVIAQGFVPQHAPAYDRSNNLIHPNEDLQTLIGSLVSIACTFEKLLLKGVRFANGKEWQFYMNVVKIELLPNPPPTPAEGSRATTSKRGSQSMASGSFERSAKRRT